MYAEFFGLRELPFNNTPDPRFFFSSPDHEEALASLIYAVNERKGFVLLTGEVGAGKTLLSRLMLRHFGTRIAFANINHSTTDGTDLLESVLAEFEQPTPTGASNARLVRILHDFLLDQFAQNTPVVLILDEAQGLSVEIFEQLRMIGNLEADDAKLLQIVILGQTELRRKFQSPELRQLKQRIFRSFHLPQLDRELTEGYILHRLRVGGADDRDIFSASAIDRIYQESQGLPRIVNTLCDNTMLSAYSADRGEIDASFVESVIEQMMTLDEDRGVLRQTHREVASREPRDYAPTTGYDRVPSQGGYSERCGFSEDSSRDRDVTLRLGDIQTRLSDIACAVGRSPTRGERFDTAYDAASDVRSLRSDMREIVGAMQSLNRDMHNDVGGILSRIGKLETQFVGALSERGLAGKLGDDLVSTVERAESVLKEARAAADRLGGGQKQVDKLMGIIRTVLSETHSVLERLNQAAGDTNRTQRQAKHAYEQITQQAQRTARLTAALRQTLDHIEQRTTSVNENTAARLADSKTHDCMSPRLSDHSRHRAKSNRFEKLLAGSRESISDLRDLIRRTDDILDPETEWHDTPPDEDSETEGLPADRLATQVQALVEMVESAGS